MKCKNIYCYEKKSAIKDGKSKTGMKTDIKRQIVETKKDINQTKAKQNHHAEYRTFLKDSENMLA